MPYRTSFTDDEWFSLQMVPLVIFTKMAELDGKVTRKEKKVMEKELEGATAYKHDFTREIMSTVSKNITDLWKVYEQDTRSDEQMLEDVADILDAKASSADAKYFKLAMFSFANDVALASGGFMGFGDKIDDDERMMTQHLMTLLRLEAVELKSFIDHALGSK
jgi:hypothetical protein